MEKEFLPDDISFLRKDDLRVRLNGRKEVE